MIWKTNISSLLCLFGDKLTFLIFNNNQKVVQIYEMNNNKYQPKFIFEYYEKRLLFESIELLKENRLEQFKQYYLMFNNDYASPIFDKNNDEIGYAYLYHPNIQDYSNYIINSNLIAFVRLYFYNAKIYLNNNKIRNGKYFLINPEFV